MSFFLHYFEINNPNADWSAFSIKSPDVLDTFEGLKDQNTSLFAQKHTLEYQSKIHKSYIISDGFSSDRIFNERNSPNQKEIFLSFLMKRVETGKFLSLFTLKLQEASHFEMDQIDSNIEVIETSIFELTSLSSLKKDALYILSKHR